MTNKPTQHNPHEVPPVHEPKTEPPPKPADDPKVLTGTPLNPPMLRFKLNGVSKSILVGSQRLTGADLYRIAGGPEKLTAGGKAIANDAEPLDLADNADVTASY
jgi:hypothetical protein